MLSKRTELKNEKIINVIDKYQTPELQRLIDNKHIEEMIKDQKKNMKNTKHFQFYRVLLSQILNPKIQVIC